MRSLVARLVAVLALVLLLPGTAVAADEEIGAYAVDIAVRADGTITVTETIDYHFPSARHGIVRRIPYRATRSDGRVRIWDLTGIRVTAPTGATPVDTETSYDGDYRVIRIGDPDVWINGTHRYVISYDVDGALTRHEGHDELYWNAVGTEWDVPIRRATVRVHAPAPFGAVQCYAGPLGARTPCRSARPQGGVATFAHEGLDDEEGLTIVAALPHGFASRVGPIVRSRGAAHPTFGYGGRPLAAAGITLLAGFGLVALLAMRGRDERWSGEVPGLEPPPGARSEVERLGAFEDFAATVEWQPPDGMRPALAGLLSQQRLSAAHIAATVVDLAVRGHLRVERLTALGDGDEWLFRRLDGADPLEPYERHVHSALFDGQDTTTGTVVASRLGGDRKAIEERVAEEAARRGWFRGRPDATRRRWGRAAALTLLGSVVAAVVVARSTRYDLAGMALVPPAIALVVVYRRMPVRTAAGSAALARLRGFQRYLVTAEAEQLRAEDRAGVFSRYLPYAMVFGVTSHWAAVLSDLGTGAADLSWYSGPPDTSWDGVVSSVRAFTYAADNFATGVTSTTSSSDSSGSSGFSSDSSSSSGGSSGGGGGGGGGSSW